MGQFGSVTLWAQNKTTTDSISRAIKTRNDSLTALRKYKESRRYKDSVINTRNEKINALRAIRNQFIDSAKTARQKQLDSAINARKAITAATQQRLKNRSDSLAALRKYKESRRYIDSVTKSRNARLDSVRKQRTSYFDSLKNERKKVLDSTIAARKVITDSIRAKQKIKADSLAKIRRYKESKRYRDSVQVTRQSKLDSIKAVRKIYSDNIISQRKKTIDSLTKMRKARLDSLTKLRKLRTDSLQRVRDLRADSLAKKKELRAKQLKADQKRKEERLKLQLELKMKKKHEAWSNEKMLKKKWGFMRRSFQNMFTRYNYYYNARRKMLEANTNMKKRKKDNYEQIIDLFPFDPNKDSTVFASDMDTIVRKASIGLQIHDPRTKWADDLYLLMGEAYYFRGDYKRAEACFKYIIGMNKALKLKKKKAAKELDNQLVKKEKTKLGKLLQHQPAHNDAILWLTRTYADSKRESDAEAILDLLDANQKLSENMKAKIALEKANLKTRKGEYSDASKELSAILNSKAIAKYTRQRASFLNGQLYAQISQYDSAAKYFKKSIKLHPPIEMDFYAHKYQAEAVALGGGDQSKSIATLKKLLKDGKYAPYHEQVYYILGKLSANDNQPENAIAYYQKSLQQGKTTPKQKAISFAAMGNIQYRLGQYSKAKKSFDSASYFAKNVKDNPEIELALKRGKSLDKLEEPYYSLRDNDSLLQLSKMSEKEQRNVARKYLKYLEQQKQDSVLRSQSTANAGSLAAGGGGGTGSTSNWYFGSTVAVQQGYNEFKRKWGNRPLSDNWRRASSSSFGSELSNSDRDSSAVESEDEDELSEKTLLAAIPKTEAQIAELHKKIKRAHINLSAAYIKDLEEYAEGLATLDSLNKKYPNHEHGDEELSIRYTAALRQGQLDEAENLRQKLLTNHPQSEFAIALKNDVANDSSKLSDAPTENVSQFYESTYLLADERRYQDVLERVAVAKRIYGDPNYNRKFRILEAESYVGLGNYKKADTLISAYVKEFPSDSLRPWVEAINKYIGTLKAADTLNKTDSNSATKIAPSSSIIAKDSLGKTPTDSLSVKTVIPDQYLYNSKDVHYCVFVFGKPDAKTAGFRSGMEDFSKIKFSGLTLNSEQIMLNAEQCMVITKEFASSGQAKIFMNTAKNEPLLFREMAKGSYQYFIISKNNFVRLKAEQKLNNYLNFYQKNYK